MRKLDAFNKCAAFGRVKAGGAAPRPPPGAPPPGPPLPAPKAPQAPQGALAEANASDWCNFSLILQQKKYA